MQRYIYSTLPYLIYRILIFFIRHDFSAGKNNNYSSTFKLKKMITSKKFLFLLPVFLGLIVFEVAAQQSTVGPNKAIASIIGKWQLQKVYAGSREIAANPNSENPSWIEFNEDGTFTQQSEGNDQGSYRLNENHSVLYLESREKRESTSATDSRELSEYSITLKDGMLTMQSRDENTTSTKYVYSKSTENDNQN